MKPRLITFLFALALLPASAQNTSDEPPPHIDVSRFPVAKVVDEVIVPVPSEVFGVLDKLGSPNWHEVLRNTKTNRMEDRPQIALLLGTVIAEGFIAVEAQEGEAVKRIGTSVLNLAAAIGVRKAVLERSKSIIDAADKKDWVKVRMELDGALQDVKQAMNEIESEQLAQLVSLGGWLRGTEALTSVVQKSYSPDSAELLHQPALLDYFQERLDHMEPRLRNGLVAKIRTRLPEIKPLIEDKTGTISQASVEKVHGITEDLVKSIIAKGGE